jgi:hypothetical protein
MQASQTQASPQLTLQGIVVPKSAVNPTAFQAGTRRQNLKTKALSTTAGWGFTDTIPMLQTGIISAINLRVVGSLVVTLGGGTCATTFRWPYGLAKAIRFSANGQSNLINVDGWFLRAWALANRNNRDDRGVPQGISGASPGTTVYQGTMSMASESWGVGQGVTAIPGGTYDVELDFFIPVAYDQTSLLGAIFAQTTSSALTLAVDWEAQANLFVLTGAATAVFTSGPSAYVEAAVYTIPTTSGGIVVPNLNTFHSLVQNRISPTVSNGLNEVTWAGQGVGRQTMRTAFRVTNLGTSVSGGFIPLAQNVTNFGECYWRYGGNTTPEDFQDGRRLRMWNEELYNVDLGNQGFGFFDFSSLWAPRDSIDEGSVTALRTGFTIQSGVTLTNAYGEYSLEELVAGGQAA